MAQKTLTASYLSKLAYNSVICASDMCFYTFLGEKGKSFDGWRSIATVLRPFHLLRPSPYGDVSEVSIEADMPCEVNNSNTMIILALMATKLRKKDVQSNVFLIINVINVIVCLCERCL